jgi:hypothetical protein
MTSLKGQPDQETDNLLIWQVWQASFTFPVKKMGGSRPVTVLGHGATFSQAIASLYNKLADEGELENRYTPCPDCGKGRRVMSLATSYVPHDAKCPAVADKEE